MAILLLAVAVILLIGAEWPRISARLGRDGLEQRARAKRKSKLTVIQGDDVDDADDFAASVQRDLENLPVIEERDRS